MCPDELPVPNGDKIGAELNKQAALAGLRLGSKDAHSEHAIWIADNDKPMLTKLAGENVDLYWPKHAIPGTKGFELLDELPHPKDYDFFVWKGIEPDMHPYGLCYHDHAERLSTGVIEFLKNHAIDTVLVGGLALDYCVKVSALQLAQAGFRVIVNLAATKAMADDSSKQAITKMRATGISFINSTTDLVKNND